MKTFDELVSTLTRSKTWQADAAARHIYEEILCRPDNIIRMVMASELGFPALSVCAKEIVAYCAAAADTAVNLEDGTDRQCIGRMVREVMESVGYHVAEKNCGLWAKQGTRPFKTAARYQRDGARLTVFVSSPVEEPGVVQYTFEG